MTPEGKVKAAVKRFLKAKGVWYFMPIGGPFTTHGIPDFICCWKGKLVAIETKAPGRRNETTPNQDRRISEINQAGGVAVVVDDVSQIEVFFT
jgi:hypothetical protein